jgi:hypothetical protein
MAVGASPTTFHSKKKLFNPGSTVLYGPPQLGVADTWYAYLDTIGLHIKEEEGNETSPSLLLVLAVGSH